jgi:hypothetical protein
MANSISSSNSVLLNLSNLEEQLVDKSIIEIQKICEDTKIKCICKKDVNGLGNFICKKCDKIFKSPSCGSSGCLVIRAQTFHANQVLIGPNFITCSHGKWDISFNSFSNKI